MKLNNETFQKRSDNVIDSDIQRRNVSETNTETFHDAVAVNVFRIYEQEIGPLTPMLSDNLQDAEKEHGANWVAEATRIASANGKRSWSYIDAILKRWAVDG